MKCGAIIEEMPFREYLATAGVSSSRLRLMQGGYQHYILGKSDISASASMIGSAVHSLVLTPWLFEQEFAVGPNVRRNANAWKEFAAENSDKILLKPAELDLCSDMAKAVLDHPRAAELIGLAGKSGRELTLTWEDESGLNCKARLDLAFERGADLKTMAGLATEKAFIDSIKRYRYDVQAAFYLRGAKACGLEISDEKFSFILVEKQEPFAVAIYNLCEEDLAAAGQLIDVWLSRIVHYESANPSARSYGDGEKDVYLPAYASVEYLIQDQMIEGIEDGSLLTSDGWEVD